MFAHYLSARRTTLRQVHLLFRSLVLPVFVACSSDPLPIVFLDAAIADAASADTGMPARDAEPFDAEPIDADPLDAEPLDVGVEDAGVLAPTFTRVYSMISAHCSCHTISGTSPRMPNQAAAHAALVGPLAMGNCAGTALVVPANAATSVLYRKITSTDCGPQEPRAGGALNADEIELVADWINAGALQN